MKHRKPNSSYVHAENEAEAQQRAGKAQEHGQEELNGSLTTAVRFRDALAARAFLRAGANPNWRDLLGSTVLGYAIESGREELVELLLSHGADPNLRTGLGTPLTLTIFEEKWEMMRMLLDAGADVNAIGTIRSTALHVALKYGGDANVIRLLLEHGANVKAKDAEGLTPITIAKQAKRKGLLSILLRADEKQKIAPKKSKKRRTSSK